MNVGTRAWGSGKGVITMKYIFLRFWTSQEYSTSRGVIQSTYHSNLHKEYSTLSEEWHQAPQLCPTSYFRLKGEFAPVQNYSTFHVT